MRAVISYPMLRAVCAAALGLAATTVQAGFAGDVSASYDVARVDRDGFEYSSTWVSIDHIENDYPGPLDSPPLAVLVMASASSDPRDAGTELGWWPLGRMAPGQVWDDLHTELDSPDLRAGEYWVHTLLVEDRAGEPIVDSRTNAWSQIWRGGIEAVGPLYVDRYDPWSPYFDLPDIVNRQFGGYSGPLELRFYRTLEEGPAGDAITLCRFEISGLYADEHYGRSSYSCDLETPLPDHERVHVEVRAIGSPEGATASEEISDYGPAVYAGSLSWSWLALLSFGLVLGRRLREGQQLLEIPTGPGIGRTRTGIRGPLKPVLALPVRASQTRNRSTLSNCRSRETVGSTVAATPARQSALRAHGSPAVPVPERQR